MSNIQYNELKIDTGLRSLIPPLSIDEYEQLEQNIIEEGCREPICIWNGYILDGHNRYEICISKDIPFQIHRIELSCYEEAIIWICVNQLGRRNISVETRKYLIGKRYEAEKVIGARNASGSNQYKKVVRPKKWSKPNMNCGMRKTAERLGSEYHISHGTVNKYGIYAQALDTIMKKDPEIVPKILSGQIKMSHENVVELSKLPRPDVRRLKKNMSDETVDFISYSGSRNEINKSIDPKRTKPQITAIQIASGTIKDMPAYDPDAGVSSLELTIPSWITSIDRARSTVDFSLVSSAARDRLAKHLIALKEAAEDMLTVIKENNFNG